MSRFVVVPACVVREHGQHTSPSFANQLECLSQLFPSRQIPERQRIDRRFVLRFCDRWSRQRLEATLQPRQIAVRIAVFRDQHPCPESTVRVADRIKQHHADNPRLPEREARRVVRSRAEPRQHQRQATQTRLQNTQNLSEIRRDGFPIRQSWMGWTITHARQIDSEGTEAHLGELSAEANVEPACAPSVRVPSLRRASPIT